MYVSIANATKIIKCYLELIKDWVGPTGLTGHFQILKLFFQVVDYKMPFLEVERIGWQKFILQNMVANEFHSWRGIDGTFDIAPFTDYLG